MLSHAPALPWSIQTCDSRTTPYHLSVDGSSTTAYHQQVVGLSTTAYHPQTDGPSTFAYRPQTDGSSTTTYRPQTDGSGTATYHSQNNGLRRLNKLDLSVQLYLHILMCVYLPNRPTGQKKIPTLKSRAMTFLDMIITGRILFSGFTNHGAQTFFA